MQDLGSLDEFLLWMNDIAVFAMDMVEEEDM